MLGVRSGHLQCTHRGPLTPTTGHKALPESGVGDLGSPHWGLAVLREQV